jgi:hypothetical protein
MPRAHTRPVASQPVPPTPSAPTWSQWPWKLQAFQVRATRDMLGVFTRYMAALGAARDLQAVGEAQRAVVGDWMAWSEGVQQQWAELTRSVPPEAWAATGWRLKPAASASAAADAGEGSPDLFEQSKLGFEMLLRPWVPAPDLEHTDEFVA